MGYRVAAVGRGVEKTALAKKLGADVYIATAVADAAGELQRLGGANEILATRRVGSRCRRSSAASDRMERFLVVGASIEPIEVVPNQLLSGGNGFKGWASGIPSDSKMRFCMSWPAVAVNAKTGGEPSASRISFRRPYSGLKSLPH